MGTQGHSHYSHTTRYSFAPFLKKMNDLPATGSRGVNDRDMLFPVVPVCVSCGMMLMGWLRPVGVEEDVGRVFDDVPLCKDSCGDEVLAPVGLLTGRWVVVTNCG